LFRSYADADDLVMVGVLKGAFVFLADLSRKLTIPRTIEFIADASEGLRADRIFFMEMNTRLQVEHPVTEEITGVDLVEWQLRVASGEPIPLKQEDLSINGWAIEARLYAEDPAKGFLPSIGKLDSLDLYDDSARIETGVVEGSEVSPFYDPMIAKVIVHAESRAEAINLLGSQLEIARVWPVKTNKGFLVRLLKNESVRAADLDTGLIERNFDALTTRPQLSDRTLSDASSWLLRESSDYDQRVSGLSGFRLNSPQRSLQRLNVDGETVALDFDPTPLGGRFEHGFMDVMHHGSQFVQVEGDIYEISWPRASGTGHHHAHDGDIIAPMPGKVIAVDVANGEEVKAGQRLMVLEAMKMEHALAAPFDGTVRELTAQPGAQVQVETLLAVVEPNEE
uniref:biotin/lipoyl-containing protein n=1 Tax=Altererythrobacter sp. TaxID=1872480 RepID=UPI003CFD89AB